MTPSKSFAAPLVSVVLPTYNCERFVDEAIASVIGQDYPNVEIIVVDDGSKDNTVQKVQAFGDRVKIVQQTNQGPAAARNCGARMARGEYLAFLDGDDVWLREKLRAQVQHLNDNPAVELVYGRWQRWRADSDGHYKNAQAYATSFDSEKIDAEHSGWVYCRLLLDSILHTITVLMRRRLFEDLGGFDEGLRCGEDYDLWIRVSRRVPVRKLAMTLALYRMHPGNITYQPLPLNYEYIVLANALRRYGYSGPDGIMIPQELIERRMSQLCFQHGYLHYWRGDRCIAATAFAGARKHGDRSLKTLAYTNLSRLRCATQSGPSESP